MPRREPRHTGSAAGLTGLRPPPVVATVYGSRRSGIDQPSLFRSGHNAGETCNRKAGSTGGTTLNCKHDCFSLSWVQILTKLLDGVRSRGKVYHRRQIALGDRQFLLDGGSNEHLPI